MWKCKCNVRLKFKLYLVVYQLLRFDLFCLIYCTCIKFNVRVMFWQVCIFAYGQTGSGKTYTMMGRPETPEQKGLIPRSLEQIFQASQSLQVQGWKYKMQVKYLELLA